MGLSRSTALALVKGMPTAGLLAHTRVTLCGPSLPCYRQEQINARALVHTPRSTLASWSGAASAILYPLYEVQRASVLSAPVLHAGETPVRLLDSGAAKAATAFIRVYAKGGHDAIPGVVYDFCTGRGAKYPLEFLRGWSGTLICDDYKGYDGLLRMPGCIEAGCLAHARRKFHEPAKVDASAMVAQAIGRIAQLYQIEQPSA